MKLVPGLYEAPITRGVEAELKKLVDAITSREDLTDSSAPHVLAKVIHEAAVRAFRALPTEERVQKQVELANAVLDLLGQRAKDAGIDDDEAVGSPPELLTAVRDAADVRLGTAEIPRPTLPLRHSDLLVNGPRDLRVGHEVRLEMASADRVDLLVSFVKWSGFRLLKPDLAAFLARKPRKLRVLTTTYLGASDAEAIEGLLELGADVKVSYDSRRTRLHAKAWLFHRESGFTTGLVGSSNLSAVAMLDGCEWNVRFSAVDNDAILKKFITTFEQYWVESEFEPYDRERFAEAKSYRDENRDLLARAVQLRPYPHQRQALDALQAEREHGHTRNLVVAATGTGKTVIAALDYARLKKQWGDPTLLFVAHRSEILKQSRATFQAAVRDGNFGELLVGDDRPVIGRHVFASIQALHQKRLATIAPDAYDVVVVDEFHHSESDTYTALLERLTPKVMLGLTATPERADGKSVLHWFGDRIAAELRLWDALDQELVVPFQYFGVHDDTDLSTVDFSSGRYDVASLERLYTADHVRAKAVLRAIDSYVRNPASMKALGFCVSVKHAEFMARFFTDNGLPSIAVSAETPREERTAAIRKLTNGDVKVVFSRDLFNEGVDIPSVDTVLFLRPTESATVFLQQLGRGLRREDGKACLTVLDFIGTANRKFRFVDRFRAMLGGTRAGVKRAIEDGFPHLPAGTEIKLDKGSQAAVLDNVRANLGAATRDLVEDVKRLASQHGEFSLATFLRDCELEPEDLYRDGRSLTGLKRQAGVIRDGGEVEDETTRAMARMLHVDDDARLSAWQTLLAMRSAPKGEARDPLQLMLFVMLGHVRRPIAEMSEAFAELWANTPLRAELAELLAILADRQRQPTYPIAPLDRAPALPFRVHATYSRDEIAAGLLLIGDKGKLVRTQGGVLEAKKANADIFFVTLDKDPRHFTPTTLYNDYPISPTRFHWESQGKTRADSSTGRRYRGEVKRPWRTLMFVRPGKSESPGVTSPYLFLGPVNYVSHESEKPMRIVWELERAMPSAFFTDVKVAAG